MRWLLLFFLIGIGCHSSAQQADSLARSGEKLNLEKVVPNSDKKESFGDYVQKVGLGIWGRVKERFNLDEVVENLEDKKNKFLGDKEKKTVENKEEKSKSGIKDSEPKKEDG